MQVAPRAHETRELVEFVLGEILPMREIELDETWNDFWVAPQVGRAGRRCSLGVPRASWKLGVDDDVVVPAASLAAATASLEAQASVRTSVLGHDRRQRDCWMSSFFDRRNAKRRAASRAHLPQDIRIMTSLDPDARANRARQAMTELRNALYRGGNGESELSGLAEYCFRIEFDEKMLEEFADPAAPPIPPAERYAICEFAANLVETMTSEDAMYYWADMVARLFRLHDEYGSRVPDPTDRWKRRLLNSPFDLDRLAINVKKVLETLRES